MTCCELRWNEIGIIGEARAISEELKQEHPKSLAKIIAQRNVLIMNMVILIMKKYGKWPL